MRLGRTSIAFHSSSGVQSWPALNPRRVGFSSFCGCDWGSPIGEACAGRLQTAHFESGSIPPPSNVSRRISTRIAGNESQHGQLEGRTYRRANQGRCARHLNLLAAVGVERHAKPEICQPRELGGTAHRTLPALCVGFSRKALKRAVARLAARIARHLSILSPAPPRHTPDDDPRLRRGGDLRK